MPATIKYDLARSARIFHALADPIRLKIVGLLGEGERCVCDLTEALDTAQSLLSFHLKTLKDAGVVTDRREGRWNYYSLNGGIAQEVEEVLELFRGRTSSGVRSRRCE